MSKPLSILKIESSVRGNASVTRRLADRVVADLLRGAPDATVVTRDVSGGLPQINEDWVGANFTDPAERNAAQKETLALSDTLVEELRAADVLVIGAPVYNFAIASTLKAWIDQIARARVTFRYTENGPEGLLTGKRAIIAFASSGTGLGSDIDFASGYLRHILGFVGITDVTVVAADQMLTLGETQVEAAERQAEEAVARLLAAA
ncbi:FMN-dependent NADH-azoreductase [Stappia indica]|uniref:FMN-dependent NADH-azoreductase n=1 Tax=Stappia indica TaxID=538381 RepID=UPI001CD54F02|nr:NAD(P)H-dependent oxidoreductase [Stappia indica]MCA1298995.1 NAD(P)H-dependent oxidoreductase [Stappia indica]